MSHPSYPNNGNAGSTLVQRPKNWSIKINTPKTIKRKVNTTINLLGGVQAIIFHIQYF